MTAVPREHGARPPSRLPSHREPPVALVRSSSEQRAYAEVVLAKARARIFHDASDSLVLPWPSAAALVGRMRPGSLVIVAAATGQGKTTFMLNLLNLLAQGEVPTDFMGTEQEPHQLLVKWAAMRAKVPVRVVEQMEWDTYPDQTAQERVMEEADFVTAAYMLRDVVHFVPELFIDLEAIESAARSAATTGARVLMIDHVDRVETGGDRDAFAANQRMIRRLKELARDHDLVVLAASQLNREARAGDRLAVYSPPQLHHMRGGGTKEEEADIALGLWRPRRAMRVDESKDEFRALLKAARAGDVEPHLVLEQNTVGLQVLKHRADGAREGRETRLHIEGGVISDITEKDRHQTTRSPALPPEQYGIDERAGMEAPDA